MPWGAAYPRVKRGKKRPRITPGAFVNRMRLSRSMKGPRMYTFERTQVNAIAILDTGTGAAAQDILGNMSWKFTDVPGYGDFTNLFDEYRINWVKVMFNPAYGMKSGIDTWGETHPFYVVVDNNDAATAASIAALGEYGSCKVFAMNKDPFQVFVRPHILGMVYQSAIATSYISMPPTKWISADNASVPHYGIKYGFKGANTSATGIPVLNVTFVYNVSCRGTR